MKVITMVFIGVMLMGSVGCGKVLSELRTDGDVIVDNSVGFVSQTLSTVGTIVKKIFGVGIAVYDIGKKLVEDTQDNVGTIVNTVSESGADETESVVDETPVTP